MTENDRNTRTLIVCFVMAMMVLIPLRMVDSGQTFNQSRVLGETEEVVNSVVIEEVDETGIEELIVDEEAIAAGDELILEEIEEVVLPNADLE